MIGYRTLNPSLISIMSCGNRRLSCGILSREVDAYIVDWPRLGILNLDTLCFVMSVTQLMYASSLML